VDDLGAQATPSWAEFVEGLEIFTDPMLCGAAAGLVLGLVGVYIVLRRMVFVSAAITHSAGLGVALAFYGQIHLGLGALAHPVLGAFTFGMGSTLLLTLNPERIHLTRESVIGLVFIFASGAMLLVGDRISQESHDIHAIIFGTAVLVSRADLYTTLAVGAVVLLGHLWLRRGIVFASFDPDGARVQRLPVGALDAFLLLSIGLMVSVTTRALGAMPVFAFSVLPAMAALSLARRLTVVLALAATLGLLSAVLGYAASFFLHFPVGASQTVVAAVFTLLALVLGRLLGRRGFAGARPS
jgi:manganese/iron transport system permease protein